MASATPPPMTTVHAPFDIPRERVTRVGRDRSPIPESGAEQHRGLGQVVDRVIDACFFEVEIALIRAPSPRRSAERMSRCTSWTGGLRPDTRPEPHATSPGRRRPRAPEPGCRVRARSPRPLTARRARTRCTRPAGRRPTQETAQRRGGRARRATTSVVIHTSALPALITIRSQDVTSIPHVSDSALATHAASWPASANLQRRVRAPYGSTDSHSISTAGAGITPRTLFRLQTR